MQVGADFERLPEGTPPADMAAAAKDRAVAGGYDALLVDTAGRLQVRPPRRAVTTTFKRVPKTNLEAIL